MSSEEVGDSAVAGAGDGTRRFLELLMGPGGGRDGEPFAFVSTIIEVMGPNGGEGEEAASHAGTILLVSPGGALVLRVEGGGADLAALVQDILAAADEGGAGLPPASKASIEAMRTVERPVATGAGAEGVEECAVCLDGLWVEEGVEEEKRGAGVEVKEMPCRHRFHGGCIGKWLGLHGSCPVCRYRMPEEEQGGGKKGSREEGEDEGERDDEAAGRQRAVESDGDHQHQQQQEQQEQAMEEID